MLQESNDAHTKQSLTHPVEQIEPEGFKKNQFEHIVQVKAELHSTHCGKQLSQS
jgi:hypothetical protein